MVETTKPAHQCLPCLMKIVAVQRVLRNEKHKGAYPSDRIAEGLIMRNSNHSGAKYLYRDGLNHQQSSRSPQWVRYRAFHPLCSNSISYRENAIQNVPDSGTRVAFNSIAGNSSKTHLSKAFCARTPAVIGLPGGHGNIRFWKGHPLTQAQEGGRSLPTYGNWRRTSELSQR